MAKITDFMTICRISVGKMIVHSGLLVSKQSSKQNQVDIKSLAKYHKINYTGTDGNNMDKFIDYQILANTLILKLEYNENISATIFPTDIL